MAMSRVRVWLQAKLVVGVLSATIVASACGRALAPFGFDDVAVPTPVHPGGITRMLAADNSQLAVFYSQISNPLPLERIPLFVKQAVLAIEDRRYYSHRGFDIKAALRAVARNVAVDDIHQGGSTITEQYVKNAYFPTAPRSLEQKIREAAFA